MSISIPIGSTLDTDEHSESPFSREMSPQNFLLKAPTISSFPTFKSENLYYIPEEPIQYNDSIAKISEEETLYSPKEIVLNFDPETKSIRPNPFLIYDQNEEEFRELNQNDGYIYFWSKFQKDKRPCCLKYLICITIFSESLEELMTTLNGVYQNIKNFRKSGISEHQICVIVMFDGIRAMSSDIKKKIFNRLDNEMQISENETLNAREKNFLFDLENVSRDLPTTKPLNSCYLYEWDFSPHEEVCQSEFTMKVLLSVKLQNGSKMSSIVWFLRGFCEVLDPKYCGLLDCGTRPDPEAFWKKFLAFETDEDIGGITGLMLPKCPVVYDENERKIVGLPSKFIQFFYNIFDIKATQVFEYGLGYILDKSFESFIGFMYVLPGAFCSFRWQALSKEEGNQNFLDDHFVKIVFDSNYKTSNEFTLGIGNLCQAEDQVITFDVLAKNGYKFKTKYLPDASAWTDPVKTFPVLMKQRKRWINGSWFAFQFTLGVFFDKMNKTLHHPLRKMGYYFYMFYMIGQNLNRYFVLCYIFALFLIMSQEFLSDFYLEVFPNFNSQIAYMTYFLICLYLMYYYSVMYKADKGVSKFQTIAILFGFSIHLFTIILIYRLSSTLKLQDYSSQDNEHIDIRFIYTFIGFTVMYYLVPFVLNMKILGRDLIKSCLAFFYHFPLYMIFFQVYAFCNIDDLTWGTKAKENLALGAKIANNRIINAKFVGKWLLLNFLVGFLIMVFVSNISVRIYLILIFGFGYTFLSWIKLAGAVIFKIKYDFYDRKRMISKGEENKENYTKESETLSKLLSETSFFKQR